MESILLKNKIEEISRLGDFIDAFCLQNNLSIKLCSSFNLSLDEIVTNTISYGYKDETEHQISVSLMLDEDFLTAIIEDEAEAFDPTAVSEVDTSIALEERQIGGLGLHLVRNSMDIMDYKRIENKNILTLKKKLK